MAMTTRAKRDPWFKPPDMPIIASYYCAEHEYRNPLVSPVYADVAGLPPIYIQVGDDEILLSDSTRIAARLEAAGSASDALAAALEAFNAGDLVAAEDLAAALCEGHYDPAYRKSRAQWEAEPVARIEAAALDGDGIEGLAREILSLPL